MGCCPFFARAHSYSLDVDNGLCAVVVVQVWQVTVCYKQHASFKPWVKHMWNCFELLRWVKQSLCTGRMHVCVMC